MIIWPRVVEAYRPKKRPTDAGSRPLGLLGPTIPELMAAGLAMSPTADFA